jgi:DNA-binding transcriptional ArsR family regulator
LTTVGARKRSNVSHLSYGVLPQSTRRVARSNSVQARTAIAGPAAIGERARARMLYSLVDGRARTATELAAVAEVTPATASVHLQRLKAPRLVRVTAQGKHRYHTCAAHRWPTRSRP